MKKVIEEFGTGASIEEALNDAEQKLNAPEDADVSREIVETQEKKILGIFKSGTIYKARAFYEIDVPEEKKAEVKTPAPKKEQPKKAVEVKKEETKVEFNGTEENGPAEQYIKSILKGLKIDNAKVLTSKTEDTIAFQIDSEEDYGCLIGRRGETLDAIQYLTRLVINRGDVDYKRVSVNVGNYREKRSQTLTELAKKNANKVLKYGRNVVLEPMNPYERRVIHTAIQEIEGVESYSIGSDDHRRVVIKLMDGVKPTNPSSNRGGRNNGRRNYNHPNNRRPNAPRPNATPKSDVSGASLYGKIEPKAKD